MGTVFAVVFAVAVYSDASEPEVADLLPRRITIAAAENFYVQFARLGESLGPDGVVPYAEPEDLPTGHPLRMPEVSWNSEYEDFPDYLAAGHGWTPARLAAWDVGLAVFAGACEDLLRLEKSQGPLADDAGALGAGGVSWQVGPQMAAAAGLYWQAGDRGRALEILGVLYRCGARVKNSAGDWSRTYGAGNSLQRHALRGARRFAMTDGQAADAVAAWWEAYRVPDSVKAFREALRGEFHNMGLIVAANDAATLRTGMTPYGTPAPVFFVRLARTRVLYPLVYKPNLTRAWYAEHVRTISSWADIDAAEFKMRGGEELLELEPRDLLRPTNLYGRMILSFNDVVVWAVYRRCSYLAEETLLEAATALRRYHARHGELPASLADLVPDYLPASPIDPVDGAPLRYSKAEAAVWSIGLDGLGKPESGSPPSRRVLVQILAFARPAGRSPLPVEGRRR